MVAVIRGGVVGGLGAFTPQIPPPRPPYPAKGKINMALPQHSTKNIIVTASYPDVSLSLSRRFTNNNYKNMKIVLHSRSSTFRSSGKIFFTYSIQYPFKAQFLNSIYLIGKISKLSLCTKLKTDAAFPPYDFKPDDVPNFRVLLFLFLNRTIFCAKSHLFQIASFMF